MRVLPSQPTGHELGVRTTDQLLHAGYGLNRLDRLVRTGELIRVWRGHYVAAAAWQARSLEDKQLARVFCSQAVPTATPRVLCRQSSALAHGVSLLRLDSSIHVLARTRRATGERHAGLRFHLTDEAASVVSLPHGLHVTTALATLIDCGRFLPHRDALVIADQFAAAGVDIARAAAWAASHAGWRGVARLRLVLERVDPSAESAGETLTRIRLREWAVPMPVGQFEVVTPVGIFRADFAWPEHMLILEFDGKVTYFGETPTGEVIVKERQREKALAALGWTVLRTDGDEVNLRPEALRARLTSALARTVGAALRA